MRPTSPQWSRGEMAKKKPTKRKPTKAASRPAPGPTAPSEQTAKRLFGLRAIVAHILAVET